VEKKTFFFLNDLTVASILNVAKLDRYGKKLTNR